MHKTLLLINKTRLMKIHKAETVQISILTEDVILKVSLSQFIFNNYLDVK